MINPDFDTMPAGPELDRLIAEKVMGWTWGRTGEDYSGWQGAPRTTPYNAGADRGYFSPSTNMADAWEVAKRCAPYIKIDGRGLSRDGHRGWAVTVWGGGKPGEALAPSAPLAICRAVLKAIPR